MKIKLNKHGQSLQINTVHRAPLLRFVCVNQNFCAVTVSLGSLGGGEALLERVQSARIRCVPALQQREHLRERARKALAQHIHAHVLTQRLREPPEAETRWSA